MGMRQSVALCLGLVALGCSASGPGPEAPADGPSMASSVTSGEAASSGAPAAGSAASEAPGPTAGATDAGLNDGGSADLRDARSSATDSPSAADAAGEHTGPLATFHDALRELECGRRQQHVRIAWLGDSHAQADFWTGTLRSALQQRFGNGGPGFVHLGYRDYRHDGVRVAVHGRWYQRPKRPSTTERFEDGNLGLGGILSTGYADQPWASLTMTDPEHRDRTLRWELCYKPSQADDSIRLQIDGSPRRVLSPSGKLGVLHHLALRARGQATLKVEPRQGRPFFCGVIIETDPADAPGVVLDNLGINGARYATGLAWNPVYWGAELARRNPELVVFEYGGNEASDFQFRPQAYKRHLLRLIERVRRVRPDVSCLVVGLADRADVESRIVPIRDATREAAREAKCTFWDTYEAMGGAGSMERWRELKKGADDGIHLRPRGYQQLGADLHRDLLADFRSECPPPSAEGRLPTPVDR